MEYCTKTEFKDYQGIDTTDDDSMIDRIIKRATQIVDNDLGYNLGESEYTKKIDGGNDYILLENSPTQVIDVVDDNGIEYDIDVIDGQYVYLKNTPPTGRKNVTITYKKGYTETPDDLKQVFLELVRELYLKQKNKKNKKVEKKSIDGISITYKQDKAKEERYRKVIQQYRDFTFFK